MKKTFFISIIFLCATAYSIAQIKFVTRSGEVMFEASVPSFEEVKAVNKDVSAVINHETGQFAALALIKGFRFKVALMEEHFNENYIESSKYPKATVKGMIQNFVLNELTTSPQEYKLIGNINLHGKDQPLEVPIMLQRSLDGSIQVTTNFVLKPEMFDIEIPKIVSNKIAEEVNVNASFNLTN